MQRWRARACAILTGVGTVRHDDPELTVRAVETTRQPVRVVVDRHAQLPPAARVLAGGNALVVTAGGTNAAWPAGVETLAQSGYDTGVDLAALIGVAKRVEALIGRPLPGQVMKAGPRLRKYTLDDARRAVG